MKEGAAWMASIDPQRGSAQLQALKNSFHCQEELTNLLA